MTALLHGRRDIPTIHALATSQLVNSFRRPAGPRTAEHESGKSADEFTVATQAQLALAWAAPLISLT